MYELSASAAGGLTRGLTKSYEQMNLYPLEAPEYSRKQIRGIERQMAIDKEAQERYNRLYGTASGRAAGPN
jgi:hypothetical protein